MRLSKEAVALGVRTTNRDVLGGGMTICLALEGERRHSAMVSEGEEAELVVRGSESKYSWYDSSLDILGEKVGREGERRVG